MKKEKNFLKRYEWKIILIMTTITLTTAIMFYQSIFLQFNKTMIDGLKEHAKIVHDYTEELIDADSFDQLNTIEDEKTECYNSIYEQLNQVRKIANIRYLYTAKKNTQGEYIYVIDGLNKDAEDFRHIGMPIEDEIIPELEKCLANKTVLSDELKNTEWGIVYIAYFPVHDAQGAVIGAVGMEFDSENLYRSLSTTRLLSIIVCILIAIISLIVSILMLRKISATFYKNLAYTDYMTNMKNRTAFELDIEKFNLNLKNENRISTVIYDLNNLKLVNDKLGHSTGDLYIKKIAKTMMTVYEKAGFCYRIGGDEFAILMIGKSENEVTSLFHDVQMANKAKMKHNKNELNNMNWGVAYGYAMFDPEKDKDIHDTFNRADENMYKMKEKMKSEQTLND